MSSHNSNLKNKKKPKQVTYVYDSAPEPLDTIVEIINENNVDPIVEPVVDPIVEPVVEPVKEPFSENPFDDYVEPVVEPIEEPVENPFEVDAPLLPFSIRPQAHDIIRTWAFYTIIKSYLHHGVIPWREIVISGHVLSNDRNKISKSQGNNPLEPENLIKQYPADAIRYWTATGGLGYDMAFSDNQLKIGLKLQTKLWNAFRFVKEHIQDASYKNYNPQHPLNQWVVHKLSAAVKNYHHAFTQNEFGNALTAVEGFFWQDFCDNYLELVKDQLFNSALYNPELIAETKATLYHVGLSLLQLYAPYMSHCTEAIYELIYQSSIGSPSLHITQFNHVKHDFEYPQAVLEVEMIIAVINDVRKLKTEKELSLKTPLTRLTIASTDDLGHFVKRNEQLLKGITHALTIEFKHAETRTLTIEQEGEHWSIYITLTSV